MNPLQKYYGIIPCRYASSRFPGKPLALLQGRPMFWHVFHRAIRCPFFDKVVVATDDYRIEKNAKELEVPVIMTRKDHPSGSDRVFEAASQLDIRDNDVVVNIQGDEPALEPKMLEQLLTVFESDSNVRVSTLARELNSEEAKNPNVVKVVFSRGKAALYFSRSAIPYPMAGNDCKYFGHIGLYAYRMSALKQFVTLGPSTLEGIEKLEQLRLLENNIPIHVAITQYQSHGVDVPEDLLTVEQLIQQFCE